ncbi:MAG: Dabb family protein [Myxococcales bacterium]|nr:MAG: Dabb family protein [Myxococcales bacterium]
MITHLVFFKLKDYSVAGAEEVRDRILAMRGRIPQVRHLEAGVDVLRTNRSWDVALIAHFDSREDLAVYSDHPVHQEFVAWLAGVRESVCAVDYESPGA